jgi:geranylgeranyl pyrophosphate synthase
MVMNLLEQGMAAVDEKLRTVVNSEVQLLHEAGLHTITSGGKRLRPQLALLSYLAAGGQDILSVVSLAAAVEMVHTATLVHDDINDHSLTRRGKITVHARWGRTFALLTGDYLFTKVYEMMAPYGPTYNVIMADACTKLVEGETLQAAAAKSGTIDRDTYKRIISLKTASLFEASARMGALLAGGDDKQVVPALADYAYNLGLTFQVVDDILDIIGDPETLGKPVGNDVAQGRGVLATQNGGQMSHRQEGEEVATAEAAAAKVAAAKVTGAIDGADPIQQMLARLRESGAVDIARLQAVETAQRARAALSRIPPSPASTELATLVDLVLERER